MDALDAFRDLDIRSHLEVLDYDLADAEATIKVLEFLVVLILMVLGYLIMKVE